MSLADYLRRPRATGPRRINRAPSPLIARAMAPASVIFGTLLASWSVIAAAPVVPPLGFLIYISWRQLRPGLLPVWAGLPLGLVDDLYSGQPFGSAVLLWSAGAIALEIIENRLPWRNYLTEWLVGAGLIAAYIVLGLGIANIAGGGSSILVVLPQIALSILVYPLIGRFVAQADRLRLTPFREIG